MVEEELFIAHRLFSNKGAYSLLLGSGVSRSAGIPTGWEILHSLINRISILKTGNISENAADWYKEYFQMAPNYSHIIQQLSTTSEERVNLLKPFFEATEEEVDEGLKQPTIAHKSIARLVQKGYIRVIITTNFDRLMENALRELGVEATVISNPNHSENVMPLIHNPITIIKINGDYLDTSFLNIESELSTYDKRMVEQLQFVFENFGLITSGWSAKWDIALRRVLESSNKFRFSNFFTYIHNYGVELKQLADFRRGKLVEVKNADIFFEELNENIEALETGEKYRLFSKPVAVARLRKYISKDEHKIALYEMIQGELEAVYKTINELPLPYPDTGTVKKIIESYTATMDMLISLIAEGAYWGKLIHHEIWVKLVSKISHPVRHSNTYTIWTTLSYYPSLLLLYTAGLTAYYRKDLMLLQKLFSIEIYNPYRDWEKINILHHVNTGIVIEKDQLNTVYGTNQYVPVSELLHKVIKPYFDPWLSGGREFDDLFDAFEFLVSLKYMERVNSNSFPVGRYAYRRTYQNNIIDTKLKELEAKQDSLDWIQGGLFNNSKQLSEYFAVFNERIKTFRF